MNSFALQERKDLMQEGYRGIFRPLPPSVTAPTPPAQSGQPISTPASPALLNAVFGSNPPPNNFNNSGDNFQVATPVNNSAYAPTPIPDITASGWLSPTVGANGFLAVPKYTPNNSITQGPIAATQAQPR